jgi:hypothetical protein
LSSINASAPPRGLAPVEAAKLAVAGVPQGFSFPPLELITRPAVDTDSAAYYLGRKAQTLRAWACYENGPIRPIRVHGRLAWPVEKIRSLLGAKL